MSMEITVEELTPEVFEPYGRVLVLPERAATKKGKGWTCWSPIETISVDSPLGIGIVELEKIDLLITEMERHVSREELLWPVDQAIIQPMALPVQLDEPRAKPMLETVRAFMVRPGQAIIMKKGAWHSAALAVSDHTKYFFAIETKRDQIGAQQNPWVPLSKTIRIIA